MTNPTDQVKYSYDALDRMTSETDTIGGAQYTISYAYNLAGNLQSITYPDHTTVTNSYDALGRMTKVAGGSTTYASFTYNLDDTVNTMTYGNGEVTSYVYDKMDRPTSITTSQGSTQELSLSYKYNAAGDVVSINSESFGYDALDRLTSSTGAWGTTTYSYDAAGNMVQKQQNSSSSATRYTYNSMDELVRSSTTSGAAATYSYDGDGNLVIKNDGTNVWTYIYNAEGEMTKVLENGVMVQQNSYDGEGRRVEQTTGATTILYLYAGLSVLFEKNLQTSVITKHVYANGMQVASITTSGTLFLSEDELGSTRLVTSGSSQVFSSDYMPYGIQYGATGSEEFMYAGMLYDAVTGLYYDNARFYDPSTGRFLSEDPIGGVQVRPAEPERLRLREGQPARDNRPIRALLESALLVTHYLVAPRGSHRAQRALNVVQGGLDPITDVLEAGAISEFVGSAVAIGASMVGLPVVTGFTEDIFTPEAVGNLLTEGGTIGLTGTEATAIAKLGGWDENTRQGLFGPQFLTGWLEISGFDTRSQIAIFPEDFGLEQFPSGDVRGFMDITTLNDMTAIEAKTYNRPVGGTDAIEQLGDYSVWRDALPGRSLLLATFNWGGSESNIGPSLSEYMTAHNIPWLRFNIDWSR